MRFATRTSTRPEFFITLAVAMGFALGAPIFAGAESAFGPEQQATKPHFRSSTGLIDQVDPGTLNCTQTTTFDDVTGGPDPGTNYDAIFASIGVFLGEKFAGQVLSFNGDFDVLTGDPTNPLTLQAGAPNQNLNVVFYITSNVIDGLGPLGFPDLNAVGEGALSMYFSQGQGEISFTLVGGNNGAATLDFFRQDGTLIDRIVLSGLANISYGFRRVGGVQDIAGVSIQNLDSGGIGLDNLCHDVAVVPVKMGTWGRIKTVYR